MAKLKKFNPHVFARRFQALCQEAGLNQVQLADKLGLTQASVSRYLSGAAPNVSALVLIAQGFGVSTDWLAGLKDARK